MSTNSSKDSFVDASGDGLTVPEVKPAPAQSKDVAEPKAEAPLSTPVKSQKNTTSESEETPSHSAKTITIFDVATEIETMLQDITKRVEDNDTLLKSKVESIYKKLDKIEAKAKKQ
ncbi:CYFA0S11e01376g1_1 [Cyberlindnera fabianii]|uniref:CYFA0S11e01376g1_1 n=1 Tax=Cyberlindnera fabianii TaxID=36022 RepID=A0A061AZW3_CYBFA|nr:hypothetical protein BON22_2869 [Cyberlindnera fabianii]CDR43201.1 CYFA0S11e01376g1_1 [Cyberlindnera fabianii]